ncbi:Cof-type HAD-IIB family hydrolase [Dictyobacter formicarum]|uniref:Haloacid dehalogenase n=1 Tax=Dictyobacter formicarum TaxID=2778368 RepID=A0ABQ3VQL4_9CHLR|nr:Cof-type HAD-IIB family hydrolase [Dictyobacter formicarum]GHO87391.1 haloacid dehalogenase [Dictyobacter formicarum]
MYRLLAIDLDGTLLNPHHSITPRTLDVLLRAMASGMHVVIATGRVPYSVHSVLGALTLNAPMITSNGATIIDTRTNTIISQQLVPEQYILSVFDAARRLDLQFCYYTHDYLYAEQVLYTGQNWYLADVPVRSVPDIAAVYPQPCIKIGAYGEAETLREKRLKLERLFAGQLYVTQTAARWLEFLHPEVSKANALQHIARLLDVQPSEIIAFGDNHNDLEMLRFAGLGVAMGNAHEEVKAVADYVTLTNYEDGVADALEKFALALPR